MQLRDTAADCQAQTMPRRFAIERTPAPRGSGRRIADKALEDALQLLLGQPRSLVGHSQRPLSVAHARLQPHVPAGRRHAHGIIDQIEQELADEGGLATHGGGVVGLHFETHPAILGERDSILGKLAYQGRRRDLLQAQGKRAGLGLGKKQQALDDALHPGHRFEQIVERCAPVGILRQTGTEFLGVEPDERERRL